VRDGQEYDGSLGSLLGGEKQQTDRHGPRARRVKKRDPMAFSDDLRRYGPGAKNRLSREASLAYCARLAAEHYENFSVVTWLTPREHRPAFRSIYAFCRWSDDLGDEVGDPFRSCELLSWWRDELRAMYRGQTSHPVMIALAETVEEYRIPIEPFERLISAFLQDQEVTRYETFEQLLEYCERSANPVGRLVLYVAGADEPENVRLADSICTGLQLANFWQDVARDLAIGRIYLPREDRDRFGCSKGELRLGVCTPAIRQLMEFEVGRAREFFENGRSLVRRVGRGMAVDIDLFVRGGMAILDAIEARGFDVLSARPSLSRSTKLRLIARAAAAQGINALAQTLLRGGARLGRSSGKRDSRDRDLRSRSMTISHSSGEESR
jgi:squalene synthase HpnC